MPTSTFVPDPRVIGALRMAIDHLQPRNAVVYYDGAAPHPLTRSKSYRTGRFMGRERTFEELYEFLGWDGYITTVRWSPDVNRPHDSKQITYHFGGGGLNVTNPFHRYRYHCVGFRGSKGMPEHSTPQYDTEPERIRYHIVDTTPDFIGTLLELLY